MRIPYGEFSQIRFELLKMHGSLTASFPKSGHISLKVSSLVFHLNLTFWDGGFSAFRVVGSLVDVQ